MNARSTKPEKPALDREALLFFMSLFVVFIGFSLSLNWLFALGLIPVACSMIIEAMGHIEKRYCEFTYDLMPRIPIHEVYTGKAAIVAGIHGILLGVCMLVGSVQALANRSLNVGDLSQIRPGVMLCFMGIVFSESSISAVWMPCEEPRNFMGALTNLLLRSYGVVILLLGLGLMLLGGYEVIFPVGFDALVNGLRESFGLAY